MISFLEQCMKAQEALQQHLWMSIPEVSIKDEAEIKVESEDAGGGGAGSDGGGASPPSVLFTAAVSVLSQLHENGAAEDDEADDLPLSVVRTELKLRKVLRRPKRLKCGLCPRVFRTGASLLKHEAKHSTHPGHECTLCDEKFLSLRKYKMHMQAHQESVETDLKYFCKYCGDSYVNLLEHKQDRHPDRLLTCDSCSETFATAALLKDHRRSEHLAVRAFICPVCSKAFKSAKSLRNHHASIHVGMKRYVCHCGHSFHRRERLQYHIDYVHEKKDVRNFQCEECPKKFRNMEALRVHRKVHSDVKPFVCQVCSREFRLRSQMQSHFVRIHSLDKSSLRTHLCDNCGKSFDCKANLLNHILRQHTVNPERTVECPICKRKYLDKKSLRRHMRMHDDRKPFLCTQCARWFKSARNLQDHINRIHLELRPYECATCGSKFKMNKDLLKHMRTHTGERPFPCPYCSYTCAVKSNLQKHISNIHLKSK